MSDLLDRARQQLDALLADIDRRETDVARAMEEVSTDAAVAAAWRQCRDEQRRWFCQLIQTHLDCLAFNSGTRAVLLTLQREVERSDG